MRLAGLRLTLALVVLTAPAPSAWPAIFGVPTNLTAIGATTGTSADPPGWFTLSGPTFNTPNPPQQGGDAVHQLRLFIEVTGTTLDIRVFDAGTSGAREFLTGAADTTTVYTLLDPFGTTIQTISIGGDNGVTQNRLARFSSAGAFTAANGGSAFTNLQPGLYEFRVAVTAGDDFNAFGVEIRDETGNHYNVYTTAQSDANATAAPAATETSLIIGSLSNNQTPAATITPPMTFYPYVDRGCSVQTSDFDGDSTGTASVTDMGGASTILTISGGTVHSENTVTVENPAAANINSDNYGLYTLINAPGAFNVMDWRLADWQGWSSNVTGLPRNPVSPIRNYLPNGYTIAAGTPTLTQPGEPRLGTSTRWVSGPNPPQPGVASVFQITATLDNCAALDATFSACSVPSTAATTDVQITIPLVSGATYVAASQTATIDGAAAACTDGSGATFRRCTFANLGAADAASLSIQVSYTPPACGTPPCINSLTGPPAVAPTRAVTSITRALLVATVTTTVAHGYQTGDYVTIAGANQPQYNGTYPITVTGANNFTFAVAGNPATPATGTITATEICPDATDGPVCGAYTPAFNSAPTALVPNTFPHFEARGPICNLTVNVGAGTALATRATLRGLRVNSAGTVEFATGSQQDAVAFNVYATDDPTGRGPRVLLNASPVKAVRPSSVAPVLYRVPTAPIASRYVMIEEIDAAGRHRFLGPFSASDDVLRERFRGMEAGVEQGGPVRRGEARFLATARRPQAGPARTLGEGSPRLVPGRHGVKIEVSQGGHVTVPMADLQGAGLRWPLPRPRLRLTSLGRPISFDIVAGPGGGAAIAFDAEPLSTDYTGRNTYILTWAGPPPSLEVALTRSEPARPEGVVRVGDNLVYVANAPQGTDPWLWDLLFGDGSTWPYDWDPSLGDFDLPGLPPGAAGPVSLRIRFVGRTSHLHTITASINGVDAGTVSFEGAREATLEGSVPAESLRETGNHLTVRYTAEASGPGEESLVYLDYLDLDLPAAGPIAAGVVERVDGYDGGPPSLGETDYLILTHPLFHQQAERIARLKEMDRHRVAVVDVNRAYDRYSAGVVEAGAIAAFIQEAAAPGRLRYVLLVGDDTFDPHDYSGTGARSFIPSLLAWDGEFGRVPSENRYADVDGDGRPDVAIGRLPVQTVEQAEAMVAKIERQSRVLAALAGRQLFAVDNQGPGDISFRAEAESAAARLPAGASVDWADLGAGAAPARAALLAGLGRGALMTHYFGHGGPEVWADESLLTVEDVAGLGPGETVLFAWACEAQWYQNLLGPSLGEALLLAPRGGALAAFGPAGITDPGLQRGLFLRIYEQLRRRGISLGEAIRRAKAEAIAADPSTRVVVEGWNLLGDPSLHVPLPSP